MKRHSLRINHYKKVYLIQATKEIFLLQLVTILKYNMDKLPPNIPPMSKFKTQNFNKPQIKIDESNPIQLELLRQLSSSPSPSDKNSNNQKPINQNNNQKQANKSQIASQNEGSNESSLFLSQKNQDQDQPKQGTQNQNNQAKNQEGKATIKKQEKEKFLRYKYCCRKCKHADRDKDKKACVCVVPMSQRRTHLGCEGCQTCGCVGCSKEDYIHRGQDPVYRPSHNQKRNETQKSKQHEQIFEARNGCCKKCMKAFSKNNKSCICQVPDDVRKTKLSDGGCKICGCNGCNPQDKKYGDNNQKSGALNTYKQQRKRRSRSRSQKRNSKRRDRRSRSNSYEKIRQRQRRKSRSRSPQIIDTYTMNFNNIDRSMIGSMIISEYQLNPALLGFGIPQRTSSYITGKFK